MRTPVKAVQILYRSTDSVGAPIANVTSVLLPPRPQPVVKVITYGSAYDSLNPEDSPSRAVAGDAQLNGRTPSGNAAVGGGSLAGEAPVFVPLLLAGYTVVIPDTVGPTANFAAGPQYGINTLDALRAATRVEQTRIPTDAKVGLLAYSGGAIATNWAAIQVPSYAPDINKRLVGVAQGGLLVNPANKLRRVNGSPMWSGVAGIALIGISRSFHVNFDKYLSERGRQVMHRLRDASISNVLRQYGNLTWSQLVKPAYRHPNSAPEYVDVTNRLNMDRRRFPPHPCSSGKVRSVPWKAPQPQRDRPVSARAMASWLPEMCAAWSASTARQVCVFSTTNTPVSVTSRPSSSGLSDAAVDQRPIYRRHTAQQLRNRGTRQPVDTATAPLTPAGSPSVASRHPSLPPGPSPALPPNVQFLNNWTNHPDVQL